MSLFPHLNKREMQKSKQFNHEAHEGREERKTKGFYHFLYVLLWNLSVFLCELRFLKLFDISQNKFVRNLC
jgi:hypothetical protein